MVGGLVALLVACAGASRAPDVLLEGALDRLGGADALERAGTIIVEAEGFQSRGAERQGTSADSADPGRYRETLAWSRTGGRPAVAFEYRHDRSDGTSEWIRETYPAPREKRIVGLADGFAVTLISDSHDAEMRRHLRRFLPELLAELLERPEALSLEDPAGADPVVGGELADGTRISVTLRDGLPVEVAYTAAVPTFGEPEIVWRLGDYREVDGLGLHPHRYSVELEDRVWVEQRVREVRVGVEDSSLFDLPEGVPEPQRVELPADGDASSGARVEELAPDVWRVRNLRTGFHPLFARLGDGVVVFDAPSGYPLLAQLPAGDVAPGASADWLSRRFLALVRETLPDLPVTTVVLTHYHGDHAGGLEAFVREGARVLAPAEDAEAIRAWLDGEGLTPELVAVEEPLELEGGRLIVRPVGPNPHTDGMLAGWLPGSGILFVSDLFHPTPLDRYPLASYERLDRAFAEWLAATDLRPERIYTMHSVPPGTLEHAERLLGEPPGER